MGIFVFFKKKKKIGDAPILTNVKKYYREDEYYTKKIHEGTPFEQEVITLDERKRNSILSERGLSVSEILLLDYVH